MRKGMMNEGAMGRWYLSSYPFQISTSIKMCAFSLWFQFLSRVCPSFCLPHKPTHHSIFYLNRSTITRISFLKVSFQSHLQLNLNTQLWASWILNASFLTWRLAIIWNLFAIQQILDHSLIMCRLSAQLMCSWWTILWMDSRISGLISL